MRVYFTIILLLCSIGNIEAQGLYRLTGKVVDKENKAVEFAAVVLSNKESQKLTGTTTASDGTFALNAKEGTYMFEVSLIGYEKYTLDLAVDKSINLGSIVLKEDIASLKEIKVSANRVEYDMSGYEYRVGNIEALKNKDLTEVLNTAPGVMVASKVTLYGSPVMNIYVDRRRIVMTEDALLDYLRSYKGVNIEKIEVISDPDISARHGGTAIKITTKKQSGGFLSASARHLINKDNHVFGANSNIDYRNGKFSLYASGGYLNQNRDKKEVTGYNWRNADRYTEDITTEKTKIPVSVNATVGIGYDLTKNDYFSAEVSFREIDRDQKRKTIMETSEGGQKSVFRDFSSEDRNPTLSLMYVHKFKDASELTITGDYVGSYKTNDYTIGDLSSEGTKESDMITNADNNTSTFAGYANYSKKIKKRHTINAGIRYSYIMNEAVNNQLRFSYEEGLLRPFASYSANLNKIGLRVGLTGNWANIDHHDYIDVIPNASINYYLNRKKGNILSAGYSMSVHRPSISQINPDAVLSEKDIIVRVGNPNLESYYGHRFNISLKLLNSYTLSGSYSMANDAITSYMYTDNSGTIYQTYTNNASNQSASLGLSVNKNITKAINLNLSATYSYSETEINGNTKRNNSFSCALVAFAVLPKSFTFTAEAFANSRKKIGYNAYKKEPFELYLSLSKKVNRWSFKFRVNDVFNSFSRREKMVIDMGDFIQTVSNKSPSRGYSITVSYNFSWGKNGRAKKANTQRDNLKDRIGD